MSKPEADQDARSPKAKAAAERKQRLSAALRANLGKRKAKTAPPVKEDRQVPRESDESGQVAAGRRGA